MQKFEYTESQSEKTAWIYPERNGEYETAEGEPDPSRLALKIRHVAPRQAESIERKLLAQGILRKKFHRGGAIDTQVVPGREADRDRAYADAFVSDWQGFTKDGQPWAYSPDNLALLLGSEAWLNKAIGKAVEEFESFFVPNGNGSSAG